MTLFAESPDPSKGPISGSSHFLSTFLRNLGSGPECLSWQGETGQESGHFYLLRMSKFSGNLDVSYHADPVRTAKISVFWRLFGQNGTFTEIITFRPGLTKPRPPAGLDWPGLAKVVLTAKASFVTFSVPGIPGCPIWCFRAGLVHSCSF